uniref:Uncharacterized protein n=1 Tax=Parascaris univalens TaxID=6257 RepID=A0A915ACC5_PARUN
MRKLFLDWLPRAVLMHRPFAHRVPSHQTTVDEDVCTEVTHESDTSKLQTSGTSLLVNVVDVDQRLLTNPTLYSKEAEMSDKNCSLPNSLHLDSCPVSKRMRLDNEKRYVLMRASKVQTIKDRDHRYNSESRIAAMQIKPAITIATPLISTSIDESTQEENYELKANRRRHAYVRHALDEQQFTELIGEIRLISAKIMKEEMMHDIRAEWMFAAMVVDRGRYKTPEEISDYEDFGTDKLKAFGVPL